MKVLGIICGVVGVLLVGLCLPAYDIMVTGALLKGGGLKVALAVIVVLLAAGLGMIFLGRWFIVHKRPTTYDPRPDAAPPSPRGPRVFGNRR